jgi:hypothetical protein
MWFPAFHESREHTNHADKNPAEQGISVAIDESVELSHEIFNQAFRKVPPQI